MFIQNLMGAILHKIYKYLFRNDRMENFLTKPHISDPIRHPVSTKVFHPAEFFHYLMRISVDVMKIGMMERVVLRVE